MESGTNTRDDNQSFVILINTKMVACQLFCSFIHNSLSENSHDFNHANAN